MKRIITYTLIAILACSNSNAAPIDKLKKEIKKILANKHATVGIAIAGTTANDTLSINGDAYYPMQSVFKFHIALAVLDKVDKGELSLRQPVRIEKKDLIPNLYSTLRDAYPNGTTLPLAELLRYAIAESDNVSCDKLLQIIGGPHTVNNYLHSKGCKGIDILYNEVEQQAVWERQFKNRITPTESNKILQDYYLNKNHLLSDSSHSFLWKTMKQTVTGADRLKAGLPKHVALAHKTGSSGANNKGVTEAVNDIGIVFLPNKKIYYISVYVSHSTENNTTNEAIIKAISKATYNYFVHQ